MATIVSNKTQEIQARFIQAGFTPEEIQAVRDAWNHGLWGDAEVRFADKDEYGIGACTNDIHLAGNFKGREVTNICRKIANRIRKQGLTGLITSTIGGVMVAVICFLSLKR
jgi:hypothetical protein